METEKLSNPKLNSGSVNQSLSRNAAAAGRIKFDRIIIIVEINPAIICNKPVSVSGNCTTEMALYICRDCQRCNCPRKEYPCSEPEFCGSKGRCFSRHPKRHNPAK